MGKILLVNTGPTEYERYGSYPVSDKGELYAPPEKWAQSAVERLLEYQVNAVYYCTAPYAFETAETIAQRYSLHAVILPGAEHAEWVSWKGLDSFEALSLDETCSHGKKSPLDFKRIFGTDIEPLRRRLAVSIDGIAEQHKKETAVVVSHRALTILMILHFLNMDNSHYHQVAQENGAINLFEVRSGMPSALIINDICHLKSLL